MHGWGEASGCLLTQQEQSVWVCVREKERECISKLKSNHDAAWSNSWWSGRESRLLWRREPWGRWNMIGWWCSTHKHTHTHTYTPNVAFESSSQAGVSWGLVRPCVTPSSGAVCVKNLCSKVTQAACVFAWQCVFLCLKHKRPMRERERESVCVCVCVCVPKQLWERFSQQRQKGEQCAPADTLSGLTQKACLGALNLNTNEHWGKRWRKRENERKQVSQNKRRREHKKKGRGCVTLPHDGGKRRGGRRKVSGRGCYQRGTPQGREGRMLWGKRKFFPLQSTGG